MTIDDIDGVIERLQATVERVGANLVEIERDPNRQMLEAATLRGTTAARWQDARDALADLFDGYARMTALVARVAEVRGSVATASQRAPELDALLAGPSIELSSNTVSISERALLDGSRKVARCTPDDLLRRMARDFEVAKRAVFDVARVWDGLVPQVAATRAAIERAGVAAGELGDEWPELAAIRGRVDSMGKTMAEDPLSVDASAVDELDRSAAAIVRAVEHAASLRGEFTDRTAEAGRELAALLRAEEQCGAAHDEVAARIVVPANAGRGEAPAFGARLDQIVELASNAQWRAAERELAVWRLEVMDARRQVEQRASATREMLAQRDELRGRLDAYNAKAAGLGLVEDAQLGRLFEAAERALYTAPSDLERAEALVGRYQAAVNAAPGRKATM